MAGIYGIILESKNINLSFKSKDKEANKIFNRFNKEIIEALKKDFEKMDNEFLFEDYINYLNNDTSHSIYSKEENSIVFNFGYPNDKSKRLIGTHDVELELIYRENKFIKIYISWQG